MTASTATHTTVPMAFGEPVTSEFNVRNIVTMCLNEDGPVAPYVTESDRTLARRLIDGHPLTQADLDRMNWLLLQSDCD